MTADFLIVGSGEMGKVVRAKDWSKTGLGPLPSWPQTLRTSVDLCLASKHPASIVWGAERLYIYNDAYRPILGSKHPQALGQDCKECWSSAWYWTLSEVPP